MTKSVIIESFMNEQKRSPNSFLAITKNCCEWQWLFLTSVRHVQYKPYICQSRRQVCCTIVTYSSHIALLKFVFLCAEWYNLPHVGTQYITPPPPPPLPQTPNFSRNVTPTLLVWRIAKPVLTGFLFWHAKQILQLFENNIIAVKEKHCRFKY